MTFKKKIPKLEFQNYAINCFVLTLIFRTLIRLWFEKKVVAFEINSPRVITVPKSKLILSLYWTSWCLELILAIWFMTFQMAITWVLNLGIWPFFNYLLFNFKIVFNCLTMVWFEVGLVFQTLFQIFKTPCNSQLSKWGST